VLFGSLSRDHHRGLLLGTLQGGLWRGIFNDNHGLGRPPASNVVRVNVRRRTNKNATFNQCQK
jgi:hypothetical protein